MREGFHMSSAPTKGRLQPAISEDTAFFWDGARERRFLAQRCAQCKMVRHPPGPACPHCHSLEYEITELEGKGHLYSYTIQHHPMAPGFDRPAIIGLVELPEGVRFVANINDVDENTLKIGETLEVHYIDQDEGWTAPQFRRPL
jgi:uncharacterized OB-fold protein